MALTTGETIGPYEIVGEIGVGGMAVVYHARHTILGSDHAIKVLHARYIRADDIRQRFLEEGRIQAQLRHPHIVPVTDVLAAPGVAGLVMPMLQGLDLADLLEQEGAASLDEAVRWTTQILQALSYVHQKGIVHRDLKPGNVFVEKGPRGRDIRVMDFGIAKVLDRSRTRTAVMMGTPAYMSPEQIRAPASVDARTDLFAVGCILYEMLSGAPAFDGDTEFDIQTRIVEGRFEPLQRRLAALPERVDAVVRKALSVRSDDRFQSAGDFVRALESRSTVAVPAPPPPLPPERVLHAPPAPPKKVRRPIELGVFSFGRRRRLVLATLGMCFGAVIGSQVPSLMESTEVWDTVQADLGVTRSAGVLMFAGSGGVLSAMFGYWLIEIGCLAFCSIIGCSMLIVFLELALG